MMDSARFAYNLQEQGGGSDDEEEEVPCFLDVYVHHARNIHNICIYGKQDVYAKFALTSAPDHAPALSTRVAAGGGATPSFHERLPPLRVRRERLAVDVLKCEVWMRSCAKALLEDQLLGFALVPLAAVAAADGARLARDFELSSTDLLHSPAGTIHLSLALHSGLPGGACPPLLPERNAEPSITSEVVILEPAPPVDHARIEFPDLNVAKENHDMAVQYLPFLQLGPMESDAMDVSASPRGDTDTQLASSLSDEGSKNASTTTTAASDGRSSSAKVPDVAPMSCCSPETPTSSSNGKAGKEKGDDVFTSPLGGIDMDAEQSEMQRQIMEMYVRSMQQFSDSLAKLKMPIELGAGDGVVIQKDKKPENEVKPHHHQQQAKNDGSRVFYGSRAFF